MNAQTQINTYLNCTRLYVPAEKYKDIFHVEPSNIQMLATNCLEQGIEHLPLAAINNVTTWKDIVTRDNATGHRGDLFWAGSDKGRRVIKTNSAR